jgi:predicted RNA-binding Zn ribbon-like protein
MGPAEALLVISYTHYSSDMGSVSAPRTADGDAFRFRAGRLSLDFCATLLWRYRDAVEQLRRPQNLACWLSEAGLCDRRAVATDNDLAQARSLREASYRLFQAHLRDEPFLAADIARVNAAARHPVPTPELTTRRQIRWLSDEPVLAALAAVGRDCIDLLAGAGADRIRECAAPDCAFLFLDTSRPGARRWCAANRCGNRQHVRDHRSRHSSGRVRAGTPPVSQA